MGRETKRDAAPVGEAELPPADAAAGRGESSALPPAVRSRAALGLTAAAAVGRFELQVCGQCGTVQYPPREACHRCLSSALDWKFQDGEGELLSETTLRHSHDEFFRPRLPIRLGMVRLDCGPTAIVFVNDDVPPAPARVVVGARLDEAGQAVLVARDAAVRR